MSRSRASRRKWLAGIGIAVVAVGIGAGAWFGPTLGALYRAGLLDHLGTRTYSGNVEQDLKALWTAMMKTHDSDGAFPQSSGWMDAIKNRIRTDDMPDSEAEKKFVDPYYQGQAGKFGFAMNDAASGKYKDDIKDPKTPLIFESSDSSRNAHGDPKALAPKPPHQGGNLAIAVDGTIVHLPT